MELILGAIDRGSRSELETLISAGADVDVVNERGMTPLMYAAAYVEVDSPSDPRLA